MPSKPWGRRILLVGIDSSAWAVALAAVTWFRYALEGTQIDESGLLRFTLLVLGVQLVAGSAARLYRGRFWIGSLDEAVRLAWVAFSVGVVAMIVDLTFSVPLVPRTVPLTSAFVSLALSCAARCAIRWWRERAVRPDGEHSRRVIVFGAGDAGEQLVRSMLCDASSGYLPVALLDDDPAKRSLRVRGVPVRGTRHDLAEVAAHTGATMLVIAVSDSDPLREVSRAGYEIGLDVQVLPSLNELLGAELDVADLRQLDLADLLGRQEVDTCVDAVAGYLVGKRVIVTGAGGSIGAELCRQIHQFGPSELFMLDRDESALHAVRLSVYGEAMLDSPDVVLADIRDAENMRKVFATCRPDVVFHAAALKHLPVLEQYPREAWKTNVLGTYYVLEAARSVGVRTFINISTDKAANPKSVLGRSKRVGERLTADAAIRTDGTYLSVRFGNVFGSRGSVLDTFAEQLVKGHPITVTHPDVSRFFMTISEAVQLVIHAAAIGRSGEALVLDMGAPVRIVDVARQLMDAYGRWAPIVYTGLREGEKLHEELFGLGELEQRPSHPAIAHVTVPPLDPAYLLSLVLTHDEVAAMAECAAAPAVPVARTSPDATTVTS